MVVIALICRVGPYSTPWLGSFSMTLAARQLFPFLTCCFALLKELPSGHAQLHVTDG